MSLKEVKEVQAPYIIGTDDEAVGRETVIVTRNGEPVAALVPFAEYEDLLKRAGEAPLQPRERGSEAFERQAAAFERLLPELLKTHPGEWVAIVNEQAVIFGPDSRTVLEEVRDKFGDTPMYIQEIRETPRVYRMPYRRIIRL